MIPGLLAAAITVVVVADDRVALRAAAGESAPRQEVLYRGDWLELRGEHAGFLRVYHRRSERPGYVRSTLARVHVLDEASAPSLAALVAFLRDAPGQESLGIAYAALWLQVAPVATPPSETAAVHLALGVMADRLARRASAAQAGPGDALLPGQLAVAEGYGAHFDRFATDGDRTRVCYDGEAFRRALTAAEVADRATAALGLTGPECARPDASAVERAAWNGWRRDVLARVGPGALRPWLSNRLHLRSAEVQAELAFQQARKGDAQAARAAATEALRQLALVDKAELLPEDGLLHDETAVRVGAVREAAESGGPPAPGGGPAPRGSPAPSDGLRVETVAGGPGRTCVRLVEGGSKSDRRVTLEQCTFAVVWPGSARISPRGDVVTVAVQPLAAWRELWVLRRGAPVAARPPEWTLDVVAPAARDPDAGYVELAGFSPDGERLLLTREAIGVEGGAGAGGQPLRAFQVMRVATLTVEAEARGSPSRLPAFRRWAHPEWRSRTVALR